MGILAALLPLALQGIELLKKYGARDGAATSSDHPAVNMALAAIDTYKRLRDAGLAAGVVTPADPAFRTDAELINLFEGDAIKFRDHAAALIEKYKTPGL